MEMATRTTHGLLVSNDSPSIEQIIECTKFSSISRLLTVSSRVLEFCWIVLERLRATGAQEITSLKKRKDSGYKLHRNLYQATRVSHSGRHSSVCFKMKTTYGDAEDDYRMPTFHNSLFIQYYWTKLTISPHFSSVELMKESNTVESRPY